MVGSSYFRHPGTTDLSQFGPKSLLSNIQFSNKLCLEHFMCSICVHDIILAQLLQQNEWTDKYKWQQKQLTSFTSYYLCYTVSLLQWVSSFAFIVREKSFYHLSKKWLILRGLVPAEKKVLCYFWGRPWSMYGYYWLLNSKTKAANMYYK